MEGNTGVRDSETSSELLCPVKEKGRGSGGLGGFGYQGRQSLTLPRYVLARFGSSLLPSCGAVVARGSDVYRVILMIPDSGQPRLPTLF